MTPTLIDQYAHLKDNAWREIAEIDEQLERGEIDEAKWHAAMARLVVPHYLSADTPWGGSGKSGTHEDWEYSRSLIAHAIDHDGSFLDVGCANGYLLESLPGWTPHRLDLYGLDIAPELVDLARRRLPGLANHIEAGNALEWQPAGASTSPAPTWMPCRRSVAASWSATCWAFRTA